MSRLVINVFVIVAAVLSGTGEAFSRTPVVIVTPERLHTLNRRFDVTLVPPPEPPTGSRAPNSQTPVKIREITAAGDWTSGQLYTFTVATEVTEEDRDSVRACLRVVRDGVMYASAFLLPKWKGTTVSYECALDDATLSESEVYFMESLEHYPTQKYWVFPIQEFLDPANKRLQRPVDE